MFKFVRPRSNVKLVLFALGCVLIVMFLMETRGPKELEKKENKKTDVLDFKSQDDPDLIKIIKEKYIVPPSTLPLKLSDKKIISEPQTKRIKKLLENKKNGFFIDCGAHDGEHLSNTLDLEHSFGWTGLLIEPIPGHVEKLLGKHRKSFVVPTCLSAEQYPQKVTMRVHNFISQIVVPGNHKDKDDRVEIMCLPLYSIMLAVNRTFIDYFSLDVEGHEMNVLRSLPWDKVKFATMTIEYKHVPEGAQALLDFVLSKGYKLSERLAGGHSPDYVFYHPDYLKQSLGE